MSFLCLVVFKIVQFKNNHFPFTSELPFCWCCGRRLKFKKLDVFLHEKLLIYNSDFVLKTTHYFSYSLQIYFCFFAANFSTEEHSWILSTYRHLCLLGRNQLEPSMESSNDVIFTQANTLLASASTSASSASDSGVEYVECRRQCAYNFPVKFLFYL